MEQIFSRVDKIELNELTILGMDKISAYIALLFLSRDTDYELEQEEFYSDLYVVKGGNKMQQLKSRIEAVLFVTAKALSLEEIATYLDCEPEEIEEAILELIMDYASRDGALEIDDENGYILQVKEDYSDIVEKICPIDLSPAVLRTLLVIALKEPIRQTELVKLRSGAYEHVAELVDKGLVSKHKDKMVEVLI